MSGKIVLYFSTVSSNMSIKKHQQHIQTILDGKKIEYEVVDISSSEDEKEKMYELVGKGALPPQICNSDQYCGNYDAFSEAVETEQLETFLKL